MPPPLLPPLPPPPGIPKPVSSSELPEIVDIIPALEAAFRKAHTGYDKELIEKGIKVMKNHLRTPKEAFEIGSKWLREMAK